MRINMMQPTLNEVIQLAKQAGKIIRDHYGGNNHIEHKGIIDLVTDVDRNTEAFLVNEITARFPEHKLVAEESGIHAGAADEVWYIDPLDGTVNFAHGLPIFAVSLAYAHQGSVKLGVVYDPIRDECYYAERGRGAWLNGQRLHVADVRNLIESLLVTGFPYQMQDDRLNNLNHFAYFSKHSQGVRRLGSAALDLCYVAAGRLDGFWEVRINSWDIAAGAVIVEEAGGVVTNLYGEPDYLEPPCSVLAANAVLHQQLLEYFSAFKQ